MKETTLVIMAAGIGSRFGKGIKQLEPIGPSGEIIMDYSIYDAIEAGFNKVVFIIRRDLEEDFKEIIGNRIAKIVKVEYVFQEVDKLPAGFTCPPNRTKPWGTGHAIWCCKDAISGPFAVINADDYYGKDPYVKLYNYLQNIDANSTKMDICMAGFLLKNTLSETGGVTRGVCLVDEDKKLVGIDETSNIVKTTDGAAVDTDGQLQAISGDSLVSMNMWGLTPAFMTELESGFVKFLEDNQGNLEKQEYLLPTIVDKMIKADEATVAVLRTDATWFGVTYQEDAPAVKAAIGDLVNEGIYKAKLF
jgi:UDP-glucose pyrophosphorylase